MNSGKFLCALIVGMLCIAGKANSALIFEFSAENITGNTAGTMSFQLFGLEDIAGEQQAAEIVFTDLGGITIEAGLWGSPFAIRDLDLLANSDSNLFKVANGELVEALLEVELTTPIAKGVSEFLTIKLRWGVPGVGNLFSFERYRDPYTTIDEPEILQTIISSSPTLLPNDNEPVRVDAPPSVTLLFLPLLMLWLRRHKLTGTALRQSASATF
jgi:hypothetical protein